MLSRIRSISSAERISVQTPQILEEKKVAGYDATVMRAGDLDGLQKWLEDHQYDARPAIVDWLRWYVDHQWTITAFKVSNEPDSAEVRWNKSVRMSFTTDKPFYPYREPADMRAANSPIKSGGGRQLKVFVLASDRYEGLLGDSGKWAAQTVWSNERPRGTVNQVMADCSFPTEPSNSLSAQTWRLTEFIDQSSPRPGTDEVYFKVAPDQATVERPVEYYDEVVYVHENTFTTSDGNLTTTGIALPAAAVTILGVAVVMFIVRKKRRAVTDSTSSTS